VIAARSARCDAGPRSPRQLRTRVPRPPLVVQVAVAVIVRARGLGMAPLIAALRRLVSTKHGIHDIMTMKLDIATRIVNVP